MGIDDTPTFVDNMSTIIRFRGIPAESSREVSEVLGYHLTQMEKMDKGTIEFLMALEAAKVLDAQVKELKAREQCPKDHLWWPKIS